MHINLHTLAYYNITQLFRVLFRTLWAALLLVVPPSVFHSANQDGWSKLIHSREAQTNCNFPLFTPRKMFILQLSVFFPLYSMSLTKY